MKSHYVAPTVRTTTPRVLCAVAWDSTDSPAGGEGYHTTAASWSVVTTRRRGNTWHRVKELTASGVSGPEALRILLGSGGISSRSYVVCTSAGDSLTLLGFWPRVGDGRISLRLRKQSFCSPSGKKVKKKPHPLILSRTPDVIGWEHDGSEFRAVSVTNHLPMPLVDVARWAGCPEPPAGATLLRPTGHASPDSAWTADALTRIYHRLFSWWESHQCGRWADTLGAAAWSWWRQTVGEGEVLQHEHTEAARHEAAAVFGGRAELFWFGSAGVDRGQVDDHEPAVPAVDKDIPERCWKLDVRSMYASILRDEAFPSKLLHRLRLSGPKQLAAALKTVCVVATVRVRLDRPCVPFRNGPDDVCYPAGEWTATYTTPELRVLLERGAVVSVGESWSYTPGTPFRAYAERLLSLRAEAAAAGDLIGGTLCKLLANALGGRLARVKRGWTTEPQKPCRFQWGEWGEVNADTGTVSRCRGIAGIRQRLLSTGERPGGLTACFAHLTAYGRVRLLRLMESAGADAVLWCDTDGLIVTQTGLDRLRAAGVPLDGAAGSLRIEGDVGRFVGRTPKHYQASGKWTLAGIRDDFSPLTGTRVKGWVSVNPVRSGIEPQRPELLTRGRVYEVDSIPLSGKPGLDGWQVVAVVRDGQVNTPAALLPHDLESE